MPDLYLSIGTNMGNREQNIKRSLELIGERMGRITAQSTILETEPWGFESQHRFLNMAVHIETELTAHNALLAAKQIERELGRVVKTHEGAYSDRPIDIDLILYDQLVIEGLELTLPHPLMHVRRFVLEPLAQIASDIIHPILHKSIGELLNELD